MNIRTIFLFIISVFSTNIANEVLLAPIGSYKYDNTSYSFIYVKNIKKAEVVEEEDSCILPACHYNPRDVLDEEMGFISEYL